MGGGDRNTVPLSSSPEHAAGKKEKGAFV